MRKPVLVHAVLLTGAISLLMGQRVGIGTSTPHSSARLEVWDNERGVLIPRMTTAERDAIAGPARSLLIYNTDCDVYQYYVPGTGWVTITHSGISGGGGGGSITALPPTGVGSSGYTAHWTPVPGATGYTIQTYNNCSGASPTLVNTTSVSGGSTSSAFVLVSIPSCNSDMCYEVVATVSTGTACGSSATQLVSNRVPIPPTTPCTSSNTWSLISGTNTPVSRDNYVIIAHKGYVYMGFGDDGSACLNDWWRWDPCTSTWTQLSSPPGTVGGLPFIFAIEDFIYVGGGGFRCNGPLSAVYCYNTQTNTWSSVAPLPAARYGAVGASDGRYGYVACGLLSTSNSTDEILRYDPVTNAWNTLTNYPPGGRMLPLMTYYGGKLWIGTGATRYAAGCTNEFHSYDLATNTWTALANYPRTEYEGHAVAYNGRIYVTGGHTPCCCTCTDQFYYYDIASNTWNSMATFPGGNRNSLQLVEIGGVLYGGFGHCPGSFSQDWWRYCP